MDIVSLLRTERNLARVIAERDDMILSLSTELGSLAQENARLKQQQDDQCKTQQEMPQP